MMGKGHSFGIKRGNKFLVVLSTILACIILAFYVSFIKGETIVYTHLFYIPIVLTGVWYHMKAIYIALFLSIVYILVIYFSLQVALSIDVFGRVAILVAVAYIIGLICETRAKAEEKLKKAKNFSTNIIATVPDSLIVVDHDLRIKKANLSFYKVFHMEPEKVIGCRITDILGDEEGKLSTELNRLLGTKTSVENLELHYQSEKLGERIFSISARGIIVTEGEEAEEEVLVVIGDITKQKRAEGQIKASLKEKEVLLQEIHHRVKNNLQLISSLLKLQSRYIRDKEDIEFFKESQNQIKSLALIHERLYQSKDLANIDFKEYTTNLANSLFHSYGIDRDKIALTIDVEDVLLGVDAAIPLGLIVNELVSNSLKHAFPEGKKGEIKIALRTTDENEIELVVSDNGLGMPKDLDFRNTESLGLHLVTILAEDQLHGKIELNRTEGTKFQIKFREAK
jgi:PAS domain S-box-containing protein